MRISTDARKTITAAGTTPSPVLTLDPSPPVIIGGFGPKVTELAGRVADGINLPGGPGLARLLEVARAAQALSGRDPSSFVVTVSSPLTAPALTQLDELGVDRAVVFVQAPFADHARRLAARRP